MCSLGDNVITRTHWQPAELWARKGIIIMTQWIISNVIMEFNFTSFYDLLTFGNIFYFGAQVDLFTKFIPSFCLIFVCPLEVGAWEWDVCLWTTLIMYSLNLISNLSLFLSAAVRPQLIITLWGHGVKMNCVHRLRTMRSNDNQDDTRAINWTDIKLPANEWVVG